MVVVADAACRRQIISTHSAIRLKCIDAFWKTYFSVFTEILVASLPYSVYTALI